MSKHFLVNKLTDSVLQLINGQLSIAPGGYTPLHAKHIDHDDVIYACQKGWAELTDEAPKGSSSPKKPEITITEPDQGMSLEELKASNEAEAKMKEAAAKTGGEVETEEVEAVDPTKPGRKPRTSKA